MNPQQMAQQIKHELQQITWQAGSQEVVFGSRSVTVFTLPVNESDMPAGFPWAMVGVDSGTFDESDPELIQQNFTVLWACEVAGDPLGEFALIGGSTPDLGSSANRGTLEVAARARAAVAKLTGADGSKIQITGSASSSPTLLAQGRHLAIEQMTLSGWCTSELHYAAPQELQHNGVDWTWEGAHVSDRFDFLQYRLVQKSGSTPSTDPSDGTVVYTGTAASFTGAASVGSTYTAFADYNARGAATVEGSSSPVVGSYVVL